MRNGLRLGTQGLIVSAILASALVLVDLLDSYGAPPWLLAFFPLLPVAITLALGFSLRSMGFGDLVRGGTLSATASGLGLAGIALSATVLIAAPMATALGSSRGFVLLGAFGCGILASRLVVGPGLARQGAATAAEAIGQRHGPAARLLVALATVLALLPLIAAEIAVGGAIGGRMLGLSPDLGESLVAASALFMCLLGGQRGAVVTAALLAPMVAIAVLLPVAFVASGGSWFGLPWGGLGDLADLPQGPTMPTPIVVALALSLLAGVATLPSLLFPAFTSAGPKAPRKGLGVGLLVIAAVIAAAPSYAVYGRLAGIDPARDPVGLVLALPDSVGLPVVPTVLLIGGLAVAAILAATGALATLATAVGHDLYGRLERGAPEGRRLLMARLAMMLAMAAALGLLRSRFAGPATLAALGLSVAAAALAPALLVGARLPARFSSAVTASIATGLAVVLVDTALARYFPALGRSHLGMGATPTVLGPTGWFGLPIGLSGLIGLAASSVMLGTVAAAPRVPWRRLAGALRPRPPAAPASDPT